MDFAISADHIVKMKENEQINRYLDLARELKRLWNMKVMMIPIVVEALGTIPKGLEERLEEMEFGKPNLVVLKVTNWIYIYPTPPPQAGWDIRSIFNVWQ